MIQMCNPDLDSAESRSGLHIWIIIWIQIQIFKKKILFKIFLGKKNLIWIPFVTVPWDRSLYKLGFLGPNIFLLHNGPLLQAVGIGCLTMLVGWPFASVVARRPGGSQTMESIKHAKEAATVIEASTSQEVEDEVEMAQELDLVEDIEYDLVEDAEEDSDYKSDFDSEKEDSNDIFDRIAKY